MGAASAILTARSAVHSAVKYPKEIKMIRKTFVWALLAGLVAAAAGAQAQTQTVDELIAKNLEARGGKDKIKMVKSLKMAGKMTMGPGMESPFTAEMVRPNKLRRDFTFQGMTGTMAFDGREGWTVMPFMGKKEPEPIAGDDLKTMQDEADFDGPLVDYKEKGHQVELVGKEDLEGTPVYKLKVTKKNGDVEYHFLDAEQYLEVKVEGKTKVRGQEVEGESTLGDYKTVNGLVYPFSIQSKQKGAPSGMTITIDKIEVNPDVPASRFDMPKPEKPAPEAPKPAKPPARR
jgi:outer membrane lipoprotein-sorting protein